MKQYISYKLIKTSDLNHHGTLFAGAASEFLVEAGFIAAAATVGDSRGIVCLNIHNFTFRKSIPSGDIIILTSQVVKTGTTSLVVHISIASEITKSFYAEGFITFIYLNENKEKAPHGLCLDSPANEKEAALRAQAAALFHSQI